MPDRSSPAKSPDPLRANSSRLGEYLAAILAGWVRWVGRVRLLVLAAAVLSAFAALDFASDNLGVNTSTADMFSAELDWRQRQEAHRAAFPQFGDTFLVVLDGPSDALVDGAERELSQRIAAHTDLIEWVYRPGAGAFFDRNALLYLSPEALDRHTDRLVEAQPLIGRLAAAPDLLGILDLVREIERARGTGKLERADPARLYTALARAGDGALVGRDYPVPWSALMHGDRETSAPYRRFVVVRPKLDFHQLLPAGDAMARVREIGRELGYGPSASLRMRLTGPAALSHEELLSVTRGATEAGLGALFGVGIVLIWGLRSWRLVVAALATLIIGLSWTMGFAAWAVGHLNLISIAFTVLYIGLGIDYAIHYCLRVRELVADGYGVSDALTTAAGDVGGSLAICTLTTGVGFFAFVPSDFSGVSELGLISGTGMFISLAASLTVLPAIIGLLPPKNMTPLRSASRSPVARRRWEQRWRWPVLSAGAVLVVIAVGLVAQLRFDANPLNLRDPRSESVATYLELMRAEGRAPWTGVVLAPNAQEAQRIATAAQALPSVSEVRHLADLVPAGQDEKLDRIDELSLLLGTDLDTSDLGADGPPIVAVEPGALSAALHQTAQVLAQADGGANEAHPSDRAANSLAAGLARLAGADAQTLARFSSNVVSMLPLTLHRLRESLDAAEITPESLPVDLRERWMSASGTLRVQIEPAEDLNDNAALRRFVTEVRAVAPDLTGTPVVNFEASREMIAAFATAFAYAFVLIAVILTITFASWKDAATVLSLVGAGSLLAAGALSIAGMSFNFANIIAVPLMLGIGVDNGVHMLHRMRVAAPASRSFLHTSTSRAVLASALTTICGFGNLAFTEHRGMSSMGVLLSLGLGFSVLCTLVLLPVIYHWRLERLAARGG